MVEDDENSDPLADLLSLVSHDVKNGLNVINMAAHQVGTMKGVEPEVAARLKRISEMMNRASRRMSDLMRDVVDLARLEAHLLQLELGPFRMNDAVRSAVEMILRDAEDRQITIDLSLEGEPLAHGDAERTANVVAIFLSNAVRVSPEGGRVRVSCAVVEGRVRVEVSDRGPGIAPWEVSTLFERPAPKRGQKRTLGRGLPLAHGVLLAQNGTIDVLTAPGEGATFTLTLPVGSRSAG